MLRNERQMNNTFRVFYSRTGFARRVAEQSAKQVDCGMCELHKEPRHEGLLGSLHMGVG